MTTVPMVTTNSSRGIHNTVADDKGAATDQTALQADECAPAFLQMLGDRLLASANKQSVAGQTMAIDAEAAHATKNANNAINADVKPFLMQLNIPGLPDALRQMISGGDDDKITDTQTDISQDAQMSTQLQIPLLALFALRPYQNLTPDAVSDETDGGLADNKDLSVAGSETVTLSALFSSVERNVSVAAASEPANKATFDLSSALTNKSALNCAQTDAVESATFEPVLHTSRTADKESTGPLQIAPISHAVSHSASAIQTPTHSALVTAPPASQLSAQLGTQEWQHQLGQQVLMFNRNGQHRAELYLHPEDLGSIQISLQMNNDQANLNMISSHSQVRAALEAAIPHLRHALAESGINLGQSQVSNDAFQQGSSYSGQQEQHRNNRANSVNLMQGSDSEGASIDVPASLQNRANGRNAVDIFA